MADLVQASLLAMQSNLGTSVNLYKYLKKSFKDENISDFFKGFYKFFYENGYDYDINGFSLIFFMPPHLSGFNWPYPYQLLSPTFRNDLDLNFLDFITFSLEVTLPDISVEKGTLGISASDTFDYPVNIHPSTDISISYLDNSRLKIYAFHSIWVRYIHAVISGRTSPIAEYMADPDCDTIDYLGSVYILKFDADMLKPRMISKALGIFPNSLPLKEGIGPRSQNQITISNVSYTCSYFYEEIISEDSINDKSKRKVLFNEFMNAYETAFSELISTSQGNP